MSLLLTLWQDLDKEYKKIHAIGQIVVGVVFILIGGGFTLLFMQVRSPLMCSGLAIILAAFGCYSIVRGICSIPEEHQFGRVITLTFAHSELLT
jgi:hypothetical protein